MQLNLQILFSCRLFWKCSIGAAQCLGELYRLFGRRITSGLTETTSIAAKLMKFHEVLPFKLIFFINVELVAQLEGSYSRTMRLVD